MSIDKDAVKAAIDCKEVLLQHGIDYRGRDISCPFPEHKDSNPSFGLCYDNKAFKCHGCDAGGDVIELECRLSRIDFKAALAKLAKMAGVEDMDDGDHEQSSESRLSKSTIDATYDYTDTEGNLVCQVVRYRPKDFRQRRPDGNGGWVWGVKGIDKPLYNLPEVICDIAEGGIIWLCEGEKDCENARAVGLTATTNIGGAGKWRDEYTQTLKGAVVRIIPDRDKKLRQGMKHALAVAERLHGVASSVRIVELPFDGEDGKDLTDYIEELRNEGRDDKYINRKLRDLAHAADEYAPRKVIRDEDKPEIITNGSNWIDPIEQIADAIRPHQEIFSRAGEIVRLSSDMGAHFEQLTATAACSELERYARFVKETKNDGPVPTRLTEGTTRYIIPAPQFYRRVHGIERICDYPAPIAKAGGIELTRKGYDAETMTYTDTTGPTPLKMSLKEGLAIIDDLLADFCFADVDGDGGAYYRSNAIIYLLSCHCRLLVEPDRCPIFYAGANRAGAGKDYLLGIGPVITTGRTPDFLPPTANADETRKRILSVCRAGRRYMIVSNIKGHLSDECLEQAATTSHHSDRVLGRSEELTYPNTAIYAISGNGLSYSEDLARRMIPMQLAYFGEDLEARTYRHTDLYQYAIFNRARILGALQSMVDTWVAAGCKPSQTHKASFVRWSETIGGIMDACGLMNPINMRHGNGGATPEEAQHFAKLIDAVYRKFVIQTIDKNTLREVAIDEELFSWMGDLSNDNGAKSRFGRMVGRYERRRFNGKYIEIVKETTRPRYQVKVDYTEA